MRNILTILFLVPILCNAQVRITDFGADPTGVNFSDSALELALNANPPANTHWGVNQFGHGVVYFPRGVYSFSRCHTINFTVSLEGEGTGSFPYQEVQLKFYGTGGFRIMASTDGYGAQRCSIKNMWLRNYGASTDSTADGIFTNTRIFIDNVACDNFGGNGLSFVTNDSGNANNSIVVNYTGYYNQKSGAFMSGEDCNNMVFYSCNFQANGMCGVLDQSFLGNMFYNCHTSSNGLRIASTYSKTWCRYNGVTYQAIKYPNQKGIEPTVTPGWQNYWVVNDAFHTVYPANWSADSTYWITGSYVVSGSASASSFFGCYSESGQGANNMNQFSMCIGGDQGAMFASQSNINIKATTNNLILNGDGLKNYDKDSTKTFSGLSNGFGVQVGSEKSGHSIMQWKYFESDRTAKLFADNSTGNQAYSIIGKGYNPSGLGITTLPRTGMVVFPYYSGYYLGDVNNGSQARNVLASRTTAPTSGTHAIGDFCLYMGSDSTIIGYRCIQAGTPGTWKTLKAAN